MTVIIVINIKDNKNRSKISKFLLNYGKKIKNSIYQCNLNYQFYKKLETGINAFSHYFQNEDFVIVFSLCKDCTKKIKHYGKKLEQFDEPLYYLV